ncbi:MAG TPA: glycoside hydrolase family 31 protein [Eubacteriales bacterium]|nr:glycoside hydrolase family 31 protein [Eubacteriales bacterium]
MDKIYRIEGTAAKPENVITGQGFRVTVLTDRLIRLETGKTEFFTDAPTQKIWYRDLGAVAFEVKKSGGGLFIKTQSVEFLYNGSVSSPKVFVRFKAGERPIEAFSARGNLKGTRRTLDFVLGSAKLDDGLISRSGVTVLDDSSSYLIEADGTLKPRAAEGGDYYIFAYGRDYLGCIKAFFKIAGSVPLLPRHALGNWWSRYFPYSEESYLALMDEFKARGIPLTVATVDMDWHLVKDAPRDGGSNSMGRPGWTGYTWNTKLFPDYKRFLAALKARGLAVTLNLHPSDGVRYFEEQYGAMCAAMGVDPATKQQIKFDMTDSNFVEAYFKVLHHSYEEGGVDFWWIDWQQGTRSKLPGLDPLWLLNHYHFLDNAKNKRPLILSRYPGMGSHRYPVGFSGDTIVAWKSLRFQPYFTATATNAAYTWWSHDIGGHVMGRSDDELYLRWIQFGVFSPINRLHSSNGKFTGKEPWNFRRETADSAAEHLRFRHRMLPYLYSMNALTAEEGEPLIRPMYYTHPETKEAYKVKNQYWFGSAMIAAPITEKCPRRFLRASAKVWLPEGRWTDIFGGETLSGGSYRVFRRATEIPVFAKAGAIIPLQGLENTGVPKELELWIYSGDGEFTLFDDDGKSMDYKSGKCTKTPMSVSFSEGKVSFVLKKPQGETIEGRKYKVILKDAALASVAVDGKIVSTASAPQVEIEAGEHTVEFFDIEKPRDKTLVERWESVLQDYHVFILCRQYFFYKLRNLKSEKAQRLFIKCNIFINRKVRQALLAEMDKK